MGELQFEDEFFVTVYSVFVHRILQLGNHFPLILTLAALRTEGVPLGEEGLVMNFSQADSCLFANEFLGRLAVYGALDLAPGQALLVPCA